MRYDLMCGIYRICAEYALSQGRGQHRSAFIHFKCGLLWRLCCDLFVQVIIRVSGLPSQHGLKFVDALTSKDREYIPIMP